MVNLGLKGGKFGFEGKGADVFSIVGAGFPMKLIPIC